MRVEVHDNQIESALKTLKKGMLKDGLFKEMKKTSVLREALGQAQAEAGRGEEEAAEGHEADRAGRLASSRAPRARLLPA